MQDIRSKSRIYVMLGKVAPPPGIDGVEYVGRWLQDAAVGVSADLDVVDSHYGESIS